MPGDVKPTMGRPTKYDPALVDKLPQMFANGESVAEVCAELGISKPCFYDWCKLYPDFSDAKKKGVGLSEAWWCRMGRAGAVGAGNIDINAAVWIFNMKNRFAWKDRTEQQITGKDGISIPSLTIGNSGDE